MIRLAGILNRILAAANGIGLVDPEEYKLVQDFISHLYKLGDEAAKLSMLVKRCDFPGYNVEIGQTTENYLQVTYKEPDVFNGAIETQKGRRWIVESDSVPIQVVQTLFKALHTSMEHRLRENFTVDKKAVLNPHFDLEKLLDISDTREHDGLPVPFKKEN